jgi:chemotaxis protein CheD
MLELQNEVSEVYLHPGESYVARKPAIIRTILGSCVGVTFWDARLGIGALSHSQLPKRPEIASANRVSDHRYVDFAIQDLARQFDELGARRSEMQVKVFGGADVLVVNEGSTRPTVGRMNCEMAVEVLREEGFQVLASSLGGTVGLHIRFDTRTGEVRLRRLR